MPRLAALTLLALIAASSPAFAFSEDTRFTGTDGAAKFSDPDDNQPALTDRQTGDSSSGIHIETRNYNDPANPGFGNNGNASHEDAFTRGYNRFGNQRE